MTNFIYDMQDELFHLNMVLPVGDFSTIKKLVDHIEAQGKQLRELNAAITKSNKTIKKYEREKKDLQERNALLVKKVDELNEGIHNSEDLTWKQKYDALLQSSEQAIGALQKKCQEYKNADTIDALVKENKELKEEVNIYIGVCNTKHEEVKALPKAVRCPWGDNAEIISAKTARIKELEEEKKAIEKRCREAEKALEHAKQVSKDLNVIINSKNKLIDVYMTKWYNLERKYAVLRGKLVSIGQLANKIDDVILSEE